jgi:hypothetical protein
VGGEERSASDILRAALQTPSPELLEEIARTTCHGLPDASQALTAAVEIAGSLRHMPASQVQVSIDPHLQTAGDTLAPIDETGPDHLPGMQEYVWFLSVFGINLESRPDLGPLAGRVIDRSRHLLGARPDLRYLACVGLGSIAVGLTGIGTPHDPLLGDFEQLAATDPEFDVRCEAAETLLLTRPGAAISPVLEELGRVATGTLHVDDETRLLGLVTEMPQPEFLAPLDRLVRLVPPDSPTRPLVVSAADASRNIWGGR